MFWPLARPGNPWPRFLALSAVVGLLLATGLGGAQQLPPGAPGNLPLPATLDGTGFGAAARGAFSRPGETPVVYVVDTLQDQAEFDCDSDSTNANCSYREAFLARGCRIIVFNVVGGPARMEVKANGPFLITDHCLFASGASGPAPVVLGSAGLLFSRPGPATGEPILQHLHVRSGGEHVEADRGLTCDGATPCCNRAVLRCTTQAGLPDAFAAGGDQCAEGVDPVACAAHSGNRCAYHEVGALQRRGDADFVPQCGGCDAAVLNPGPPDFSGCNDLAANDHGSNTGITVRGPGPFMADHLSIHWAMSNAVTVRTTEGGRTRQTSASVTNSIVGNGDRADSSAGTYGHREKNHNYNLLLRAKNNAGSEGQWIARNVFAHAQARNPRYTGGQMWFLQNVVYNPFRRPLEVRGRTLVSEAFVMDNLFHLGPDSVMPANLYCEGGGDATDGRPCTPGETCTGTCTDAHPQFAWIVKSPYTPAVYLDGNAFLNASSADITTALPQGGSGEWGTQWDRVRNDVKRPPLTTQSLTGTSKGAELLEPPPVDYPLPRIDPRSLGIALLPLAGATQPCRTSEDQALIGSILDRTAYVPPPAGGRHFPVFQGTPHVDSDADGLWDDWELTYWPDLSSGPLEDAEPDGYVNIYEQEFGSDPLSTVNVDTRPIRPCVETQ